MLVLLQTAIPADGTVVEEGFSKLQVFLQQLIDWGVAAGGNIIGAILIFVIGRFLISLYPVPHLVRAEQENNQTTRKVL